MGYLTASICKKCNRNLSQNEIYFYYNLCSDCISKELEELSKKSERLWKRKVRRII